MICIDSIWLATETMDMRAGTETALARVIAVFSAAQPHFAYLFAIGQRESYRVDMSGYFTRSFLKIASQHISFCAALISISI